MTKLILNLANGLPKGLTYSFNTPCAKHHYTTEVINEALKTDLPAHIRNLQQAWKAIPMGKLTRLAPTTSKGHIDNCTVDGIWPPELQRLHGGILRIRSGFP